MRQQGAGTTHSNMRIGQILLEAGLITPKQLTDGLAYGKAKNLYLGKSIQLLKIMSEADVERALQLQKMIKLGLSPKTAIEALKKSVTEQISVESALEAARVDTRRITAEIAKLQLTRHQPNDDEGPELSIKKGDELLLRDRCIEAEAHYQHARKLIENISGKDSIELAPILVRLGNTYLATNCFDKARESYEKVMEIRKNSLPEDHPQIAQSFESLADLYYAEGDEAKGILSFLSALDILENHLPQQLGAYASILRKIATNHAGKPREGRTLPIGEILKAAGLLPEAELQTALRMSKQQQLPLGIVLRENCMVGDRELQSALKAQFCVRQGVLTEQLAVELLVRAARRDISLERLLHEAGVMVTDEEKFDTYRQISSDLDLLVKAESSALNSQQQELAPVAYRLGSLYEQVGDQVQAEVYYSRALSIWGQGNRGDLTAARTCSSLAKIQQGQMRHAEALPLLRNAVEHRQHALGTNHEETISSIEDLAEGELEVGNLKEALAFAQEAQKLREALGQEDGILLRSFVIAGDAFLKLKDFDGALKSYKRAQELAKPEGGKPTSALAAVMEKQGDLYSKQELYKVAIPLYKSARMILEAAGKKDSKASEKLLAKISELEAKI